MDTHMSLRSLKLRAVIVAGLVVLGATAGGAESARADGLTAKQIARIKTPPMAHFDESTKPPEASNDSSFLTAPPSTKPGLMQPNSQTPNDTRWCPNWSYVAADFNSYIIGNCQPGSLFYRREETDNKIDNGAGQSYYWDMGYTPMPVGSCGWMRDNDLSPWDNTTHTGCDPYTVHIPDCNYMACTSGGASYHFGSNTDGASIPLKHDGCYLYANIRPFTSGQSPTGQEGRGANGGGGAFTVAQDQNRFKVRYLAKYAVGGNTYYMVHDGAAYGNTPNWGFMYTGCFQ